MSFTPVRMIKDGRSCLVGSATEREQFLLDGYKVVEDKPAAKPAEAEKPEPAKPASK